MEKVTLTILLRQLSSIGQAKVQVNYINKKPTNFAQLDNSLNFLFFEDVEIA